MVKCKLPFIFSSFFPEEYCSTGPEHTWHWQQGTSTAQKSSLFISETLVSLLCLTALHTQLGRAHQLFSPYLPSLTFGKCSSLSQDKMQNAGEEQGFICSNSRYRTSVTWRQVMCLVPVVPAPRHQARHFCLVQKANWKVSLWAVLSFPHHKAGKKVHCEKEICCCCCLFCVFVWFCLILFFV